MRPPSAGGSNTGCEFPLVRAGRLPGDNIKLLFQGFKVKTCVPTLMKSCKVRKRTWLVLHISGSHRLNLNQKPVMQRSTRNGGTRRTVFTEHTRVDLVHW